MAAAEPGGRAGDIRARLLAMPPEQRVRVLETFGLDDAEGLDLDWPSWAHDGQTAPPGDWSTWVIMAGRGFGKTRAGSEWVAAMARSPIGPPPLAPEEARVERRGCVRSLPGMPGGENLRIALVGATIDEARRIMVEGESGLLAVAGDEIESWRPTLRTVRFASGAEAALFSGASPDALRGFQHHYAWCDELAKWERARASWDMLRLGLRLGARPRALVTTTPRPGATLKQIMAATGTIVTGGPTRANRHLPDSFIDDMHETYAGTRLERQELEGELLTDAAGALWTIELIERCRVSTSLDTSGESGKSLTNPFVPSEVEGRWVRTVIGVDPTAAGGTCGIIACAKDANGIGHVLADHSVTARGPEGWARAVAIAADIHGADYAVAEINQGGRMVEAVLRTAAPNLKVRPVTAQLNKSDRAEPVAHLFEAGKVVLHARFPELEAELCGLIAGGGYEGPGTSPDRADAMVWALTELMLGKERVVPRIRTF